MRPLSGGKSICKCPEAGISIVQESTGYLADEGKVIRLEKIVGHSLHVSPSRLQEAGVARARFSFLNQVH